MMSDSIPGFRFYPTEEELISFYLVNKLQGVREDVLDLVIPVLNIYDFLPSDLQQYSGVKCRGDPEQCFFLIPRQESEARGGRPSRLTETGYWKATGSPSYVYSSDSRIIGLKRTMVFYTGRAPHGNKTQWKMNEYKAIQLDHASSSSSSPTLRQEYSLCRVYKKTKCIRAFDRRPTRVHETDYNIFHHHNQQQLAHHDHHQYDHIHAKASMIMSNNITTTQINRASSHDGSTASSSPENRRSGGAGPAGALDGEAAGDEGFWVIDWDNALNFMEEEK